jgi:hypothetical protein
MQETHDWHVSVRIVLHHRLVLGNLGIMRTVGLAIPRRTCYRRPTLEESVLKYRYLYSPRRVRRLRHTCPASPRGALAPTTVVVQQLQPDGSARANHNHLAAFAISYPRDQTFLLIPRANTYRLHTLAQTRPTKLNAAPHPLHVQRQSLKRK